MNVNIEFMTFFCVIALVRRLKEGRKGKNGRKVVEIKIKDRKGDRLQPDVRYVSNERVEEGMGAVKKGLSRNRKGFKGSKKDPPRNIYVKGWWWLWWWS